VRVEGCEESWRGEGNETQIVTTWILG